QMDQTATPAATTGPGSAAAGDLSPRHGTPKCPSKAADRGNGRRRYVSLRCALEFEGTGRVTSAKIAEITAVRCNQMVDRSLSHGVRVDPAVLDGVIAAIEVRAARLQRH